MPIDSATQSGATGEHQQEQLTQDQIDAQTKAAEADAEAQRKEEEEAEKRAAANPRLSAMDAIAESRRAKLIESGELTEEDARAGEEKTAEQLAAEEKAKEEADAKAKEEAERKAQLDAQGGEPTVIKAEDLGKFRVVQTIDGTTKEVPLEEVVRTAQKSGAADYRLATATKLLEEAQATAKELAAKGGKTEDDDPDKGDGAKKPKTEAEVDALVKDALDKALDGDLDAASTILAKAMRDAQGRSATPATEDIVTAAVERIARQQVFTTFQSEYSDVVSDKNLGRMVDQEFRELATGEDGKPIVLSASEFDAKLKEAGNRVRKWKESFAPKAKETDAEKTERLTREERARKKLDLDQTTGSGARSSTTAEPASPTASSVIAEIAKARGQEI